MFPINELLVRSGEIVCDKDGRLTAAFTKKWNALVRGIAGIGKPTGRGIRRRTLPDGVIVSMDVRATVRETPAFPLSVLTGEGGAFLVRVGFGLVGGFEPEIDGTAITEEDDRGDTPALTVRTTDFDASGRARLYFKVSLLPDWSHKQVEIVARSATPTAEPYTGYKLLGLLISKDGGSLQVVHVAKLNLGHETSERRADGTARHWWWAE